MRRHLTDRAQRRIRNRTDERVRKKSTQRSRCRQRPTRTQEETSSKRAGDGDHLDMALLQTTLDLVEVRGIELVLGIRDLIDDGDGRNTLLERDGAVPIPAELLVDVDGVRHF